MKKKVVTMLCLLGVSFTITGCGTDNSQTTASSSNKTVETSQEAGEAHLDYDNQDDWEFTAGEMQSPIDIPTSKIESINSDEGQLTLNYDTNITSVENNGHSIEVTDGGQAILNGRNFTLTQFHFHAESEHTVDGKYYPMEGHFVNTTQSGRIAVIGVFYQAGAENKGFQEVLDDVNQDRADPITDLEDLLPTNHSYYHYLGSLTTPPLTENVEWYVMKTPVELSSEQIEEFKTLYSHNNREIQPLNDRAVLEYTE